MTTSADIHAAQVQRNLARFGTRDFPGMQLGQWPDGTLSPGLAPLDPTAEPRETVEAPAPAGDDFPLWEG